MAKRIAPRFDTLLAKDLSDKDRTFVKSLYASYKSKGSLTPGRRTWLGKMEERYTDEKIVERAKNLGASSEADRINDLLSRDDLSAWEKNFLNSIKDSIARFGKLTAPQAKVLTKVEGEHNDEGLSAWREKYRSELRERAVIVAEYYIACPPYFEEDANRVLDDPDYVMSERSYKRMCENKYAKRVLKAHNGTAKYPEDTMVEARSFAASSHPLRGKQGFIIQTDVEPVTRAAKGSKKYLVLPVGETKTVVCEERDIKKVRG